MRLNTLLAVCAVVALLAGCKSAEETKAAGEGGGQAMTQPSGAAVATGAVKEIKPGTEQDLVANYGDRIFFDFNKADLRPDARQQIEKWADFLKKNPQDTVTVEGHCDERGTREYNLALGERRAAAAQKYLIALGIDAKRISTISYGKERPAVGSNEAAWAQNRRDVMVVN
jgi:peptidoglycan-associated lipoprotein